MQENQESHKHASVQHLWIFRRVIGSTLSNPYSTYHLTLYKNMILLAYTFTKSSSFRLMFSTPTACLRLKIWRKYDLCGSALLKALSENKILWSSPFKKKILNILTETFYSY